MDTLASANVDNVTVHKLTCSPSNSSACLTTLINDDTTRSSTTTTTTISEAADVSKRANSLPPPPPMPSPRIHTGHVGSPTSTTPCFDEVSRQFLQDERERDALDWKVGDCLENDELQSDRVEFGHIEMMLKSMEWRLRRYKQVLHNAPSTNVKLKIAEGMESIISFQSEITSATLTDKNMKLALTVCHLSDEVFSLLRPQLQVSMGKVPWHRETKHVSVPRTLRRARDVAVPSAADMAIVAEAARVVSLAADDGPLSFQDAFKAALVPFGQTLPSDVWKSCLRLIDLCGQDLDVLMHEMKKSDNWSIPTIMRTLAVVMGKLQSIRIDGQKLGGQTKKDVLMACLRVGFSFTRPSQDIEQDLALVSSLIDSVVICTKMFAPFLKTGKKWLRKILCCGKK